MIKNKKSVTGVTSRKHNGNTHINYKLNSYIQVLPGNTKK